jgi:hypothetical protein
MRPTDALYATLTGEERACLALAALARGDDAERQRLTDTCPREIVRVTEFGFRFALDAIYYAVWYIEREGLTMLVSLLLARRHGSDDDSVAELGRLVACREVWLTFCDEIGIEPRALVVAATGKDSRWLAFADNLAGVTPAEEATRAGMLSTLRAIRERYAEEA